MRILYIVLSLACMLGLALAVYQQRLEIHALRAELEKAGDAAPKAEMEAAPEDSEEEIARLKKELEDAQAALQAVAPAGDEPFENALDVWIGRVRKLSGFLRSHPELRIPHMDLLTEQDWLDVTKGELFETEADYRKALGKLRGIARQKVGSDIAKAIKVVVEENGGTLPDDPRVLAAHLPGNVSPAMVDQLRPMPEGSLANLRVFDGTKEGPRWVFEDKAVDSWDSTLFYSANGGWGSRSAQVKGEDLVRQAIAQHFEATGRPPQDASELMAYGSFESMEASTLQELFRALTTIPEP